MGTPKRSENHKEKGGGEGGEGHTVSPPTGLYSLPHAFVKRARPIVARKAAAAAWGFGRGRVSRGGGACSAMAPHCISYKRIQLFSES
jgi:hypothetical protein